MMMSGTSRGGYDSMACIAAGNNDDKPGLQVYKGPHVGAKRALPTPTISMKCCFTTTDFST